MSLVLRSAEQRRRIEGVEMMADNVPAGGNDASTYSGDCFFIGIDFGTTCTGVAWTYSRKPDDADVIQSWPGGLGDKVPSTIIYHKDGRKRWGFEAPPEDPSTLQWFKLLLMDEKDMKPEVRSHPYVLKARKAIEQSGKQPREVVRDYLALVWAHAIDNIAHTKRRAIVDSLPFRVVLTVPAIWGRFPHVTRKLREAARQAGILDPRSCGETELSIVAEPEAAAFATLKDGEGEYMLQKGDIFVMCDAGGGTVDLITYEMRDVERMAVSECVEADGDVKGSIFLDEEMEKCLSTWLGRRWTGLTTQEREDFKKNRWMTMKWEFDGTKQTIPAKLGRESAMSGLKFLKKKPISMKVKKEYVYFEWENLAAIFGPITRRIIELVGKQIQGTKSRKGRGPKVLILVGGLGGNRYLRNELKAAYPDLEIIQRQGDEPITSICRGAVLKAISRNQEAESHTAGMERIPDVQVPRTISRVPTLSYGVLFFETFEEGRHHPDDRKFDVATQKHVAKDLMYWYVTKGKDVLDGARPSWTFRKTIQTPLPDNRFTVMIWKCDSDDPPESKRDRSDISICTPVVCKVETPFIQLPRCENSAYREIMFQLDLLANGVELQFVAKINGKVSGELVLPYDD